MRIAVPVENTLGLASPVCPHFGSAPCFAVVESENGSFEVVSNGNVEHVHGACHPAKNLMQYEVDAVLVAGIGRNALLGLMAAGIRVYQATAATLAEAVQAIQSGDLVEFGPEAVCCGAHEGGCGCHHE